MHTHLCVLQPTQDQKSWAGVLDPDMCGGFLVEPDPQTQNGASCMQVFDMGTTGSGPVKRVTEIASVLNTTDKGKPVPTYYGHISGGARVRPRSSSLLR